MRVGIFGASTDPQTVAVAKELSALGAEPIVIEHSALDQGWPVSFDDGHVFYRGDCLDDLRAFFLRFIPGPSVPAMRQDERLVLYADWYRSFMQSRERNSFFLSWLLRLEHFGVPLVNPPHAASVQQFKPFQLDVLRAMGAQIPRTLISNDPERIREFKRTVGDVIYKPVMGGAITRALEGEALDQLDQVTDSPVIFQQRVRGDDLRVMLVGDEVVSCLAIDTPEPSLDFRSDPTYLAGEAVYREVKLPPKIQELCRQAARACHLTFAGIDIKHQGDDYVFLELNCSPMYLESEQKSGHRISHAIAKLLVEQGQRRPG